VQICSAVQLCGFVLCLTGAARITHRAQGIVSIAAKWHMVVTNASAESEQCQMPEVLPSPSASDSDSSEIHISVTPQPCFFHNRQALGENSLYLDELVTFNTVLNSIYTIR